LFATTELNQLLKLPLLAEHFIEHREENKHLSLWQFLCSHYAYGDVRDADYDKDMKLPFKSHENCVASISTAYILLMERFSITKPFLFSKKKSFITKGRFLLFSYLSNIWQPPRSC